MLEEINRDRLLDLCPLGDEVRKHLRLNSGSAPELDGVCAKFDHPLNDVAIGFLVVKDVAKWKLSNHSYLVSFEIMVELVGCT
jgi:hypothetical protein